MKKLITNIYYWIVAILVGIGLICIISEPATQAHWFTTLALSKVIGIAFCALAFYLIRRWMKAGKLDFTDLFSEED